ncbi:lipopolysaccharide biosynthesis protein [Oribacterium sp. WCC10]|uniref:lipopolysaccharide biosynthesis protein n=1 Tax=Oribacterium sp. WCC10 TaxID=1855343 RepID=UPI0008EA66B2|nr:polysaccharides export protein [Oribacterium sp. WCC10]SFG40121.1 Membrane protein involved in the export of O-antigen and teichoic acid [Oribacterium sp. WCC10]
MTDTRRDFLWNAAGSLAYAMASIVLAFAVIRIIGPDEGGIFGFGFSTLGQQMFIIAYFGIRPFHITDMKNQFSFGDYLLTRRITSLLAIFASFLFVGAQMLTGSYTGHKAVILFLLSMYKVIDGYADVYESELQRQGKLYRTGQSLAFRTGLSVLTLLSVLLLTGNLSGAVMAADIMQLIGTYLFAVRPLKSCPEKTVESSAETDGNVSSRMCVDRSFSISHSRSMILSTGLLFISVFVDFYIFSASKYAIDARLSDAVSGYFNVLFMPTSFIYLIANFMIRPMLTKLADQFAKADTKAFSKTCRYMVKAVAVLSLIIILGAVIFGKPGLMIFELILGASTKGKLMSQYVTFILLIAGGGLYALANVMYYILVTLRKQLRIFAGYVVTAVIAALSAGRMVEAGGMTGGAMNYVMLMGILVLLFFLFAFQAIGEMKLSVKKASTGEIEDK